MATGTVIKFRNSKRFGRIQTDAFGELFVHTGDLVEMSSPLENGRKVQFDIAPDGKHVMNVQVIDEPGTDEVSTQTPPQEETEDVPAEVPATQEEAPVVTGTVTRFDQYGRGVIVQDDGPNVYVDYKDISVNTLGEGQQVEFKLVNGEKGPQAKQVRVIENPRTAEVAAVEPPRHETAVDRVARFGKKRRSQEALQRLQNPVGVPTGSRRAYTSRSAA